MSILCRIKTAILVLLGKSAKLAIAAQPPAKFPLTCEPHNWYQITDNMWVHVSCSRVRRDASFACYDTLGYLFLDNNGKYVADMERFERKLVTFPYTPVTKVIKVYSPEYVWFRILHFFGVNY